MFKQALIVAVAAAGGEYLDSKYGAKIEAEAVKLSVPPTIAHMGVVGGFAAGVYFVLNAVM